MCEQLKAFGPRLRAKKIPPSPNKKRKFSKVRKIEYGTKIILFNQPFPFILSCMQLILNRIKKVSQSHLPNALDKFDSMLIRCFTLPELNTSLVFKHSNGRLDEGSLVISYCGIEKSRYHEEINAETKRML